MYCMLTCDENVLEIVLKDFYNCGILPLFQLKSSTVALVQVCTPLCKLLLLQRNIHIIIKIRAERSEATNISLNCKTE